MCALNSLRRDAQVGRKKETVRGQWRFGQPFGVVTVTLPDGTRFEVRDCLPVAIIVRILHGVP